MIIKYTSYIYKKENNMNKMRIFKLYIYIYQEDTKDEQNLHFILYFLHLSERIISKNFERAINFYY